MYCRHCGKEIFDDAKYCESCGNPTAEISQPAAAPIVEQKETEKKKKGSCGGCLLAVVVVPLLTFLILMLISTAAGPKTSSKSSQSVEPVSAVSAETEPTSISIETEPASGSFTIPGTLAAENFDLSIVSATISSTVVLNSGIDITISPDEGKQFLVFCIDATNTSNEVRNLGSFTSYVDGSAVLPHNVLGKYGDRMLFVGAVDPGKSMGTYILYQVPAEWETFELYYVDSLTGSRSGPISISRSEIA